MARELNEEGEALREEFESVYKDSCCYCHLCPPCNYCVHPGNPMNLAECDDLWVEVPDEVEDARDRPDMWKPDEAVDDVMDITRKMFE